MSFTFDLETGKITISKDLVEKVKACVKKEKVCKRIDSLCILIKAMNVPAEQITESFIVELLKCKYSLY
jgi:hypothetical protein